MKNTTCTLDEAMHLADQKALQLAILLSVQEAEYGINMLDAIGPLDYDEIQWLKSQGCDENEAKLTIFENRYVRNKTDSIKSTRVPCNINCNVNNQYWQPSHGTSSSSSTTSTTVSKQYFTSFSL